MRISFKCPQCGGKLEMDERDAPSGAELPCPHCDAGVRVPSHKLGPGVTLGGFTILKRLGQGAMGVVYLARQESMDRKVALKILPPQLAVLEDSVERFRHEVRMAARVEHTNLVPAYEAGEDSGIHFLAMAYVEGDPLDQYIQKKGALSESEALGIIRKVAGGLAQAWERHHLLHRDVKPGNIIMDRYGEPRLTDLGLAKCLDDAQQITMTAMSIGTPNYMSPEQVEGQEDIDQRSDIYGLGSTLYQMLTGKIPFGGSSVSETLRKQLTEKLPDPRKEHPELSGMCVDLLALMLAKDRDNRYQSYADLIADIDLVLSRRPPSKSPLQAGESMMMRAGQGEKKQVTLTHSKAERLRHMHENRIHPPAQEKRKPKWPFIVAAASVVLLLVSGIIVAALSGRGNSETGHRSDRPQPKPTQAEPARKEEETTRKVEREEEKEGAADYGKQEQKNAIAEELRAIQSLVNNNPDKAEEGLGRLRSVRDKGLDPALLEKVDAAIALLESRIESKKKMKQMADAGQEDVEGRPPKGGEDRVEPAASGATETAADKDDGEDPSQQEREGILGELVDSLLVGDLKTASERLETARASKTVKAMGAEWDEIEKVASRVVRMHDVVMESFQKHRGREIPIQLKIGTRKLRIDGVDSGRLRASKVITKDGRVLGSSEHSFAYQDLTAKEKMKRLGREKTPATDIMRGLLAAEAGADQYRRRYLERADCPLADLMLAREAKLIADQKAQADARRKAALETAARRALGRILVAAHLPAKIKDMDELVEDVRKRKFSKQQCERIKSQVAYFRDQFSETDCAAANERLLNVLGLIRPGMPLYVDKTAVEKIVKKLNEINPRCGVNMSHFEITDEGVVAKLGGLGNLADISPLSSLPIVEIDIGGTQVEDINPLTNLPLHTFRIKGTQISLSNCSVLRECPIQYFNYKGSHADNIDWMKELDLYKLIIYATSNAGRGRIRSLEPLKKSHLRHLYIHGHLYVRISDLSPLRGMPLRYLSIGAKLKSSITDLSPLRGAPLEFLALPKSEINDLAPLASAPLEHLNIAGTGVNDLSPLHGAPLKHLDISDTNVEDVSPLLDSPLESLNIKGAPIKNISVLNKMSTLKRILR